MNHMKKSWWALVLTLAVTLVMFASPAGAQTAGDPYERPPAVLPDAGERPVPEGTPVVLGDVVTRTGSPSAAGLPVTGGDVLALALLGTGAVAVGGGLLLTSRRRTATTA